MPLDFQESSGEIIGINHAGNRKARVCSPGGNRIFSRSGINIGNFFNYSRAVTEPPLFIGYPLLVWQTDGKFAGAIPAFCSEFFIRCLSRNVRACCCFKLGEAVGYWPKNIGGKQFKLIKPLF